MRIVSFNIQNRRGESPQDRAERLQACAAFLKSLEPDLIGLQEVTPDAWNELGEALHNPEAVFTPRVDGMRSGEGAPAICLNPDMNLLDRKSFWFSETPESPSLSWRAAHPRVCSYLRIEEAAENVLWMFNLHLDHRSRLSRRKSLGLLRERIQELTSSEDGIVICGDFNMPGYRKDIKEFLDGEPRLADATHFHPVGSVRPTYLGWGPLRLARARIDLCLHSENLKVKAYHAENPDWKGRRISDHRAVVVDFSRRC